MDFDDFDDVLTPSGKRVSAVVEPSFQNISKPDGGDFVHKTPRQMSTSKVSSILDALQDPDDKPKSRPSLTFAKDIDVASLSKDNDKQSGDRGSSLFEEAARRRERKAVGTSQETVKQKSASPDLPRKPSLLDLFSKNTTSPSPGNSDLVQAALNRKSTKSELREEVISKNDNILEILDFESNSRKHSRSPSKSSVRSNIQINEENQKNSILDVSKQEDIPLPTFLQSSGPRKGRRSIAPSTHDTDTPNPSKNQGGTLSQQVVPKLPKTVFSVSTKTEAPKKSILDILDKFPIKPVVAKVPNSTVTGKKEANQTNSSLSSVELLSDSEDHLSEHSVHQSMPKPSTVDAPKVDISTVHGKAEIEESAHSLRLEIAQLRKENSILIEKLQSLEKNLEAKLSEQKLIYEKEMERFSCNQQETAKIRSLAEQLSTTTDMMSNLQRNYETKLAQDISDRENSVREKEARVDRLQEDLIKQASQLESDRLALQSIQDSMERNNKKCNDQYKERESKLELELKMMAVRKEEFEKMKESIEFKLSQEKLGFEQATSSWDLERRRLIAEVNQVIQSLT
jgi:hypothetical protein